MVDFKKMLKENREGKQLYNEFNPDPKLILIFQDTRISKSAISRIYDKYGSNAYNLIKQNPYCLIDDIYGIGFTIADHIASRLGVEKSSDTRIHAGITYILKYAITNMGHTCLPFNDLVRMTNDLLELQLSPVIAQVDMMLKEGLLITINDLIYDRSFYETEKYVGEKLRELLKVKHEKVSQYEVNTEKLADDQLSAIVKVLKYNVFILTGAPGTGKTYTIKYILELLGGTVKCRDCDGNGFGVDINQREIIGDNTKCQTCNGTGFISRIKLAAPTGKAAKRMYEQTGKQASTIHKLLEPLFNTRTKRFQFTRNETNPIDADTIILDEVSMMDVKLTELFLRAVSPGTRLIMIGDIYQLPPVGAGYVLRDMIQSGVIPYEELTIIKRQDAGLIIDNCHRIKNGQEINYNFVNNLSELIETGEDFGFIHSDDINNVRDFVVEITKGVVVYGYNEFLETQNITPRRDKTPLSCEDLNEYLQDKLNPNEPVKIGKNKYYSFRVGDKVIQLKNNYQKGIMNGDIGYIQGIDPGYSKTIKVQFESPDRIVEIPMYGKDNNLQLAYAITCHKYQGSENKIIIIPIHRCFGSLIMQRNWLYTAISRASELCILIGDKSQIPIIINRNFQVKRFTNLQEFLKG